MQRTIILTLSLALSAALSQAQIKSGSISYQQVISLESAFKGQEANIPENIAALMPKEQKHNKILYFSENASLYENNAKKAAEEHHEIDQGNMHLEFRNEAPDEKIYTDIKTGKRIQQKDLMGRMFLVTDPTPADKWRFTGRQKMLLNHPCMEAIKTGEHDTVTAWYTTDIPVSTGPEGLNGLPGMILEAGIGNDVTITATEILENAAISRNIKEPSKGKKISSEEFRVLAEKKRAEMMKESGGGGNVIIRTITR